MSKKAKIVIISVVCAVVALTIILSVSLTVGSFNNRFIRQMTKRGYTVIDYASEYHRYEANDSSYFSSISAERIENSEYIRNPQENIDAVRVYIFKNKNDAKDFYEKEMRNIKDGEQVIQKGKKVYIGTVQGLIDAGV